MKSPIDWYGRVFGFTLSRCKTILEEKQRKVSGISNLSNPSNRSNLSTPTGSSISWPQLFAIVVQVIVPIVREELKLSSPSTISPNKSNNSNTLRQNTDNNASDTHHTSIEAQMLVIAWKVIVLLCQEEENTYQVQDNKEHPINTIDDSSLNSSTSHISMLQDLLRNDAGLVLLHLMLNKEWKNQWTTFPDAVGNNDGYGPNLMHLLLEERQVAFKYPGPSTLLFTEVCKDVLKKGWGIQDWVYIVRNTWDHWKTMVVNKWIEFESNPQAQQIMEEVIEAILEIVLETVTPLSHTDVELIMAGVKELLPLLWTIKPPQENSTSSTDIRSSDSSESSTCCCIIQ